MKKIRTLRVFSRAALLSVSLAGASALAIAPERLNELRARAETGDGIAQHNLGLVYANSQEEVLDLVEAYAWLSLAADNGATGRTLALLRRQMTPEQVSAGQRRLDEIREAIETKKKNHATGLVTTGPTRRPAAASTSAESTSPISPIAPAQPEPAAPSPILASPADPGLALQLAELKAQHEALRNAADAVEKNHLAARAALQKERDELTSTLAVLTQEIGGMKAAAANFEGERNGLLQKVNEARTSAEGEWRLKLVAAETDLNAVRHELELLKQEKSRLETEAQAAVLALEKANAALRDQTQAADKAATEVRQEIDQLKVALTTAEAAVRTGEIAGAELAAAQLRIQKMDPELQEATRALQEHQTRLTALQKEYSTVHENTRSELATLRAAAANFEGERNALLQKLDTITREHGLAGEQIAALQNQLNALKGSADEASRQTLAQLEELRTQLTSERAHHEAEKNARSEDQQKLNTALAERDELAGRLQAATQSALQELNSLREAAAAGDSERLQLKSDLAQEQEKRGQADAEIARLTQALAAAQAAQSAATGEVTAAPSLPPAEIEAWQIRVKTAEEALTALQSERDALARQLTLAEAELQKTRQPDKDDQEAAELRQRLAEASQRLEAELRSFEAKQSEIAQLQDSLVQRDNERAELAERIQQAEQQAAEAKLQAAAGLDAAAQVPVLREQLRRAQRQINQLAEENNVLKQRMNPAVAATPTLSAPRRPGDSSATTAANRTALKAPEPRQHVVVSGDTLTRLARRYYGDSERWAEIYDANRAILPNPTALKIGMKLRIP